MILIIWMGIFSICIAQDISLKDRERMRSIQIINPNPQFSLRLELDKKQGQSFVPGENINIRFNINRDSYVTLYNYDVLGRVKVIFPNRYMPNNFVKAGREYKVEGQIAPDTQPGIEFVQGFATTRPLLMNNSIRNMISRNIVPQISNDYRSFVQRMRSVILPLPSAEWTSSNLLSINVVQTPPPMQYGSLWINSNPSNAKVYLNDKYRGTSPIKIGNLNQGYYTVKVEKSGYEVWESKVQVTPLQTTQVSAQLKLLHQQGSISISCNQSNAKIYLDGDYQKRTSSSKAVILEDVSEGYHELLVTKEGYQDWNEKIYVTANQEVNVFINLMKSISDGSISIFCNEKNAKIYLDGKYKRRTLDNKAVELQNVEPGYHELLITKEGFQDWKKTIMVTPNQTYMVSVFMIPEMSKEGSIAVSCNVDNAKIFVNGTYKMYSSDSQPKLLEDLEEGGYEITVIKDGYRTWLQDVWVYPGETTSIYVDMNELKF